MVQEPPGIGGMSDYAFGRSTMSWDDGTLDDAHTPTASRRLVRSAAAVLLHTGFVAMVLIGPFICRSPQAQPVPVVAQQPRCASAVAIGGRPEGTAATGSQRTHRWRK